jgi:hypothetical protein
LAKGGSVLAASGLVMASKTPVQITKASEQIND